MGALFFSLRVIVLLIFISGGMIPMGIHRACAATDDKAANKDSGTELPKVVKPMAFWAATPPDVVGKMEAKYDINGDGILQTSEIKVLLRHIYKQVQKDNINFNVNDSQLLKAYDKNKDGIISKLELEDIKKDLSY